MTELKTLKDISWNCNDIEDLVDELRAEAIKWIKAMISGKSIVVIPNEKGEQKHWIASDCLDSQLIDWIKHFFNITEEELK